MQTNDQNANGDKAAQSLAQKQKRDNKIVFWGMVLFIFILPLSIAFLITQVNESTEMYHFKYTYTTDEKGVIGDKVYDYCVKFNTDTFSLLDIQKKFVSHVGVEDLEATNLKITQGCNLKEFYLLEINKNLVTEYRFKN